VRLLQLHSALVPVRRRDWVAAHSSRFAPGAAAVCLGTLVATNRHGWLAASVVLCLSLATVFAVANWQTSALFLIAYLPFTGLLSLALYPDTFLGEALRDLIVVFPLYIALLGQRDRPRLPRSLLLPLALLTLLACVQLLNPSLPSLAVGLVGLRGWVFFIPLALVGARLALSFESAERALRLAMVAGLPVLVIGLIEALLLAEGKASVLYGLYGESAKGAFTTGETTAQGARLGLGDLHRVPSLFSYSAAYYCFCLAMLVPSYFLWRKGSSAALRKFGLAGFVLTIICALTSGTREAFLTVPIAVGVMLYLDGVRVGVRGAAAGAIGWTSAIVLLGVPLRGLPQYLWDLSLQEGRDVLGYGFSVAHSATWLGLGPGTDTNAARAFGGQSLFDSIGGSWQEAYLVKSWIELGVPGLLLVLWTLIALSRHVLRGTGATGPQRTLCAAAAGLIAAVFATSIKGAVLDQAPANAYFWLTVGFALGAQGWVTQQSRAARAAEDAATPTHSEQPLTSASPTARAAL
jgi:hypothetical protein